MAMTTEYLVHVARFQSGERLPVLLYRETLQPVVLATRYILDECRQRSQANTLLRSLRVLKWFYEWCGIAGIGLESRLRRGRPPTAGEITGFCRYLRARNVSPGGDLAGLTGQEVVDTLSPATFNFYLGVVERFLIWAAYEFVPMVAPPRDVRTTAETCRERIQRAFRSNKLAGKSLRRRYGLEENEIAELREAVRPESLRNPFRAGVRFRNYVIVELMLATGAPPWGSAEDQVEPPSPRAETHCNGAKGGGRKGRPSTHESVPNPRA